MDKATRSQLAGLLAGMEKEDLMEASRMVRDAFSSLERREALAFKEGDRVRFEGKKGVMVEGTVEYPNEKTVTVKTDVGLRWRVSPSFLEKI
jgi:hypothetical protein